MNTTVPAHQQSGDPSRFLLLYAVTGMAVLAGAYFRFKGLGASPFAIDEYYIARAVDAILEHGLPQLEGGGFYTRGIALQYIAAPLFMTGLSPEVAFRLVTVLFNLAALPAVFLLARHLAGAVAGCIAVILFSLAVWEVEFARFARMYAPFGTLFLWHLYFLYRRTILDRPAAAGWMYGISLCSIFFTEFAVFLALLNFLPALLGRVGRGFVGWLAPLAILVATDRWMAINFRYLGVMDPLPADMSEAISAAIPVVESNSVLPRLPIHYPTLLLPGLADSLPWLLGFLALLAVFCMTGSAWVRWARRENEQARTTLTATLAIGVLALTLLNLVSLAIWGTVIVLLLSGLSRPQLVDFFRRAPTTATMLSAAVATLFWAAYLWVNTGWQALLPIETGNKLKDAILILFNYPNILREVVVPWRTAMPWQSLIMSVVVLSGVWIAGRRSGRGEQGYLFLTAILIGCVVMVPVFRKVFYSLRYTYFVYPLFLILVAAAAVYIGSRISGSPRISSAVALGLTFLLMLVSEDFEARHLLEIDSPRVIYRMGYTRGKIDQYYQRWDFRGPADFVNAHRKPGDVVISAEYGVPYYLDRIDYIYLDQESGRFGGIARERGAREVWEGTQLLRSQTELLELIQASGAAVWLIIRSDQYGFRNPGEEMVHAMFSEHRVYQSVDSHLDVYRIPATIEALR